MMPWFPGMQSFAARIGKDGEPVTLQEALDRHPQKWYDAVADELQSHEENKTWELTTLPPGKKEISSKWVFKLKVNADDTVRYKARLVIRGFEQKYGLDFQETFAPVAKFATVRIMLALAAQMDWEVHQMDVKTAFLYPDIQDEVYMTLPEGFDMFHKDAPAARGQVARLRKTLYGLRQAPRAWYQNIDDFFKSCGLIRSCEDFSLYLSPTLAIVLYVDDILLFAKDAGEIVGMKKNLKREYKMVDLGELRQFLGLQVQRNRPGRKLFIHQRPYVEKILERFQMQDCKGLSTPMELKFYAERAKDESLIIGRQDYQSKIGSIMYAMLGTCPDLAYTISTLSKASFIYLFILHTACSPKAMA